MEQEDTLDAALAAPPTPPRIAPGTAVGGFRVLRLLGQGGMGSVFLARDAALGRMVALKLLHRGGDPEAIERLLQEARATASFNHPHIVGVYSVGLHEGSSYIALEYVEGESLRARLDQATLPWRVAARTLRAVADALAAAHAAGVAHRDLKPENVLLGRDGRARVADFGLARVLVERPSRVDLTADPATTGLAGTPAYMAPEQWAGRPSTASDIWALGVMLHELVTGRKVSPAQNAVQHLARVACKVAPEIDDAAFTPELLALLRDCLAWEPAGRPSAVAVRERLDALLTDDRPSSAEESPFRGLEAFGEEHRGAFFGRDLEVSATIERLRAHPVLTVVGPSGVGKSSFVLAGLLPRLRDEGPLRVVRLRPGASPVERLAAAVAEVGRAHGSDEAPPDDAASAPDADTLRQRPGAMADALARVSAAKRQRVVLVVDALEELLSHDVGPDDRAAFLQAVYGAASDPSEPVRVVVTLRDDFLGRVAQLAPRGALDRVAVLRSPDGASLRECLLGPLRCAGYRLEGDAMAGEMLAGLRDDPAALPLLQFAAQRLWEQRDVARRVLTRASLEAIGGVAGALARHADGVIDALPAGRAHVAREILLRLVTPERTRQSRDGASLVAGLDADAEAVLRALVDARIVTAQRGAEAEGGAYDLAHESLVRRWERLARWLDASGEAHAALAEVQPAAAQWARQGARTEHAWTGEPLRRAADLLLREGAATPPEVRRFLEAGRQRERRSKRARRAAVAAVIAVLAAAAGASALAARRLAREQRATERARALAVQQRAATVRALAESDIRAQAGHRASAGARLALELEDSLAARALWIEAERVERRWVVQEGRLTDFWVWPDRDPRWVLQMLTLHEASLIDAETLTTRRIQLPTAMRAYVRADWTVSLLADGAEYIPDFPRWMAGDRAPWRVEPHRGARGWMLSARYSLDETPHGQRVVNSDSGAVVQTFPPRWGLRVFPDGRRYLAGDAEGALHLGVLGEGRDRAVLPNPLGPGAMLPNSPVLHARCALFRKDERVAGVNLEDQRVVWPRLPVEREGRRRAACSVDGAVAVQVDSSEGALWRYDVARDVLDRRSLAGTPDGSWMFAAITRSDQIVLQDMGGAVVSLRPQPRASAPSTHGLWAMAWLSDDLLLTAPFDGEVQRWRVRDRSWEPVPNTLRTTAVAVAGGDTLLRGTGDGEVWLQGMDGRVRWRTEVSPRAVFTVLPAQRGAPVLVLANGATVHALDAARGTLLRSLTLEGCNAQDLVVSPDRTRAVVPCHTVETPRCALIDLVGWRVLREVDVDARYAVWSRDGRSFTVATQAELRAYAADGAPRSTHPLPPTPIGVRSLADGLLGVMGSRGLASLIDPGGDRALQLEGSMAGMRVDTIGLSPDGARVAAESDGALRVWDAPSGRPAWRGVALFADPPAALTHEGLRALGDGTALPSLDPRVRAALDQRAIETARAPDGTLCARTFTRTLECWSPDGSRCADDRPLPFGAPFVAVPGGCVALVDGAATLHRGAAATSLVGARATALGASRGGGVWVLVDDRARRFDAGGAETATRAGQRGAQRVLELPDGTLRFGDASVSAMAAHPGGRVFVVGRVDGSVEVRAVDEGATLLTRRLYGPVRQLVWGGGALLALTELGDALREDLSLLFTPRCKALRAVAARTRVVFEDGSLVRRGLAAGTGCRD